MKPTSTFFLATILFFFSFVGSSFALSIDSTSTPTTTVEKNGWRFIVYYSGNLTETINDDDSYLKTFLAVYNLELVNTFQIDESNKGFTVEIKGAMESPPREIAKELSLVDDVLMVEVIHPDLSSEL